MKWDSAEFLQLQEVWYAKLAESGFVDAECAVGTRRVLIQQASNVYRQADELTRETKLAYFEMLSRCAYDEAFSDEAERIIMIRHSEGIPIKAIAVELQALGLKCHRLTVRRVIHKYEDQWRIRPRPKARKAKRGQRSA